MVQEGQWRFVGGGEQDIEAASRLGDLTSQNVHKYDYSFTETRAEANKYGGEQVRFAGKKCFFGKGRI